jgi:hypothetical protein
VLERPVVVPEAGGQAEPGKPALECPVTVAGGGQRLDRICGQAQPTGARPRQHEPATGGKSWRINADSEAPHQAIDQPPRPAGA